MLSSEIRKFVSDCGYRGEFEVEPAPVEASVRRYFRLRFKSHGADPATLMLCTGLPAPYNDDDHFVKIAEFLREEKIPAPRVLGVDRERGLILQTDVGTRDLCSYFKRAERAGEPESRRRLLFHAIDMIVRLQKLNAPPAVRERRFDFEKLHQEMEFLFEALRRAMEIAPGFQMINFELAMFLKELCGFLGSAGPMTFAHRDYHSRNIMLREDQGVLHYSLIDFQDARLGLPYYDLASLLYDPYAPLNAEDRRLGLDYYFKKSGRNRSELNLYHACALQRLLKALGTYLFQVAVRENPVFMDSIPQCLARAEEVVQLGRFPDSAFIFVWELREKFFPELRRKLALAAPAGAS